MDAVEFLKEALRFCKNQPNCDACELLNKKMMFKCALNISEDSMSAKDPEKLVKIIERWSAEHSVKTRQDIIIREFPNIEMIGDFIDLRPCDMDPEINCPDGTNGCTECKKRYWLTEVEE